MSRGISLGRRQLMLTAGAAFWGASALGQTSPRPGVNPDFAEIERDLGGRVGVAALDTGSGRRLSYRGGERFALCSTFKLPLVAEILSEVAQGRLSLGRRIAFSAADLLGNAPVSRARLAEGSLPVADLCGAAIEVSDNTAANLLLNLTGGPPALTAYLRSLGDAVTRLDRNEMSLNDNLPGDERDTTSPEAMIGTLSRILIGDALPLDLRARLIDWMKNCRTGRARLRAGMPAAWAAGDKTGTGPHGAVNDCAIVWPPARPPILIAAYLSGSSAAAARLDRAHAKIGAIIATSFG